MKKFILSLCGFLLFAVQKGYSQTEVYGRVIDAETKEPVPYVNVKFRRSAVSTSTDPNGLYRIVTLDRVDSLAFSCIGYKTVVAAIRRSKQQELDIEMGSGNISLTEVTVKVKQKRRMKYVDTAANYVYYRVMENRERNRPSGIASYSFDAHTKLELDLLNTREKFKNFFLFKPFKFVFSNADTTEDGGIATPVLMREIITQNLYRKKPKASRTVVLADKISGVRNESIGRLVDQQFEEFDVYQDVYLIASLGFPSPFARGAPFTYRYYLTDTLYNNDTVSYKLYFVGKTKEDLAMKGYAWIDSATWAIRFVDMKPNERANINFINEYRIRQQFTRIDTHWLPVKESLYTTAKIINTKKSGSFLVRKTNLRSNYQLNVPFPDSLAVEGSYKIVPGARQRSEAFWDSLRMEPLSVSERKAYENVDSVMKTKAYRKYYWSFYLISTAYFKCGPIDLGRFYKFVSKNSVEGVRLRMGGRTNQQFSRNLLIYAHTAYGLKDRDWKYELDLRYVPPSASNRWQAIEFVHKYDMVVLGQENLLLTFDNFVTLLRTRPLQKVMKIRQTDLNYEVDWFNGFGSIFSFSHKTFFAIPGVFDFARPVDAYSRVNIPQFTTTELSVYLNYTKTNTFYVSEFYRYYIKSQWPNIEFKYTAGVPKFIDGEYHYHKLFAHISQRWPHKAGHLRYDVRGGYIFGNAPYPAAFVHSGNLSLFWDSKSYNLMREFEFITDRYMSVWLEQNFDGFFFNKIPYFNKLGLREVIHAKLLWGDMRPHNRNLMIVPPDMGVPFPVPYVEMGFGIDKILEIFRVDFLWRVTHRDKFGIPNWGVKINVNPGF